MEKFDNEFASVFYDEQLDAISLVFKKNALLDDFIKINQKVLDIFLTLKTNRFYVDTRNIGVVSPDGQKWVIENLFPGMLKHIDGKTLYHVQVIPKEIFGKVAVKNIKTKAASQSRDTKLVIEAFEDEREAKKWLTNQQ